ncbi:nitrilase-related carbon-nitrogen hydrolase [Aneurinibacillus terranovensis]|uniref:nitrilase-related carbon-nitrogen hydrolase n=1 Tax=Aneurinibacillus terranovensis TaxID=278991 RepID=UPI000429A384|nr:nitrilase-related carbon-nitrogen hydrolase [Aneurinibacillus terranovensis]
MSIRKNIGLCLVGLPANTILYIVGGTHIRTQENKTFNSAFLFHPDGKVDMQDKVHLTAYEKNEWQLEPGNQFYVFETRYGKIAILVCYDIEFPEAARKVCAEGANIIFCSSSTDDEQGFHRVRYTCHARAIENQVYVVHTGGTGWLPTNFTYKQKNGV